MHFEVVIMDRNYTRYDGTEIIEQGKYEVTWEQVRKERNQCHSSEPLEGLPPGATRSPPGARRGQRRRRCMAGDA